MIFVCSRDRVGCPHLDIEVQNLHEGGAMRRCLIFVFSEGGHLTLHQYVELAPEKV